MNRIRHFTGCALLAAFLAGCGNDPIRSSDEVPASKINAQAASIARAQEGKPYQYGGISPSKGFDCSGLVYYSYSRAGRQVPRSTHTQRKASIEVSRKSISIGDLVFFNQEGKYSSHVGMYIGGGRFIHAPSSGKRVRVDSVNDPYWQKFLVDVRRFR